MPLANSPAIDLDSANIVHLSSDLAIRPLTVDATFWSALSDQQELSDGRILSVFEYEQDWTWWERHPTGAEFAYLLEGEIEFHLSDRERLWSVPLSVGKGAVIPRNTWHSGRIPRHAKVLFVTPTPASTEHHTGLGPP